MSALVVDGVFHHVTVRAMYLSPHCVGSTSRFIRYHLLGLQDGDSRNTHEDIIMFTNGEQWEISIRGVDVKEKRQSLCQ